MKDENVPEVQVDFTLGIGPGRLDVSLNVSTGDLNITQLLPVLQNLSSNVIGAFAQNVEQEGHRISCKAGCGACCRQLVPLNLFEAEFLANWIRTLPADRQRVFEERFDSALKQLSASGVLETIGLWNSGDNEASEKSAMDYLEARVPCPFLENESCGIHSIRPMICREYLVTTPAEFCYMPTTDRVVGVPMPVKLSKVLFRLASQVEPSSRGWLPLVFLFVWMKTGSQPGAVIHGPGPELLHEIVKRIAAA